MPFVQIFLPERFNSGDKTAISRSVHESLMENFHIPEDDYFQVIQPLAQENILFPPTYLGIRYSNNLIYIYITCAPGRTAMMKQTLYALIAKKVAQKTSVTKDDVIIVVNETARENWSLGQGIAQMIVNQS